MTVAIPTSVPKVARKTVTHIFIGAQYKERYVLPGTPPAGSTVRKVFVDSGGSTIVSITGSISGNVAYFNLASSTLISVPDGAGFYCYLHLSDEASGREHMIAYGTTFVR